MYFPLRVVAMNPKVSIPVPTTARSFASRVSNIMDTRVGNLLIISSGLDWATFPKNLIRPEKYSKGGVQFQFSKKSLGYIT